MTILFRSRIDAKFKVLAIATMGVGLSTLWLRPKEASAPLWALLGLLMLGAAAFVLWITFLTYYELEHDALRVRSGPFSWRIPLGQISAVRPTNSSQSSPAMSMERLEILYGSGRSILISPANQEEFLRLLQQRVPRLASEPP